MAKYKINICERCGEYTKHKYVGKCAKDRDEKEFNIVAGIVTLGIYTIVDKAFDQRPGWWECCKCGRLTKG